MHASAPSSAPFLLPLPCMLSLLQPQPLLPCIPLPPSMLLLLHLLYHAAEPIVAVVIDGAGLEFTPSIRWVWVLTGHTALISSPHPNICPCPPLHLAAARCPMLPSTAWRWAGTGSWWPWVAKSGALLAASVPTHGSPTALLCAALRCA